MGKKIQIVLLVILFVLIFMFYKIFFLTEKKVVIQQRDKDKVITQEKDLNEIEKLRYFSEDISGNKYTIVANSASAILVDNNLVELSGVLANIVLSNKSTIYITSSQQNIIKLLITRIFLIM